MACNYSAERIPLREGLPGTSCLIMYESIYFLVPCSHVKMKAIVCCISVISVLLCPAIYQRLLPSVCLHVNLAQHSSILCGQLFGEKKKENITLTSNYLLAIVRVTDKEKQLTIFVCYNFANLISSSQSSMFFFWLVKINLLIKVT